MKAPSKIIFGAIAVALIVYGTGSASELEFQTTFQPHKSSLKALPPIPPATVQLVLDDDSSEGAFGVGQPTAQQFLWFNRFTPGSLPFTLEEIWVLFPPGPNLSAGAPVEVVVYHDPDGNPSNGADLVATFNETIQVVDGNTFSVYPLAPGIVFSQPGDVLIGVVDRFVTSGVTSATQPAAIDTGASQGRSWLAVWTGDPPNPPLLPPDNILSTIDGFIGGNWMIRGFGSSVANVPAAGNLGFAVLVSLMAIAGFTLLLRRQ